MNIIKSNVIILLLLLLGLISCNKKDLYKTVVLLFDLSESTNKKEIIKNYLDGLKIILSNVNHGDVVVGVNIVESSFSEPGLPVNEKIPPFIPTSDNPFFVNKEKKLADNKLKQTKEKIYKTAEKLILRKDLNKKVLKTDILSSLNIAEQIFKRNENEIKILVIFSDMIQESSEYNFEKENLSERKIEEIISKEKKMHRIPDLTGVKVYIVGATARTRDKFFSYQNFWRNYFKECGASIENYSSSLIKF